MPPIPPASCAWALAMVSASTAAAPKIVFMSAPSSLPVAPLRLDVPQTKRRGTDFNVCFDGNTKNPAIFGSKRVRNSARAPFGGAKTNFRRPSRLSGLHSLGLTAGRHGSGERRIRLRVGGEWPGELSTGRISPIGPSPISTSPLAAAKSIISRKLVATLLFLAFVGPLIVSLRAGGTARQKVRCSDNHANLEVTMRGSLLLAIPLVPLALATSALAQNMAPSQGQPISSSGKEFIGF